MTKIINSNKARTIGNIELKKGKNEVEFATEGDYNEWLISATGFVMCEAITFDSTKTSSYIPENEVNDTELD